MLNVYKKMFVKICCFLSKFKIPFRTFVIRQPKLFQMIVSDEFLEQCETETFLKFNSCFSTEFAHYKNTYVSEKLLQLYLDVFKSIK